jgi:hypothetical protein
MAPIQVACTKPSRTPFEFTAERRAAARRSSPRMWSVLSTQPSRSDV